MDIISRKDLVLSKVVLKTMPLPGQKLYYVTFIVESNGALEYDHAKSVGFIRSDSFDPVKEEWEFVLADHGIIVSGDVSIRFYIFDDKPDAHIKSVGEMEPGGSDKLRLVTMWLYSTLLRLCQCAWYPQAQAFRVPVLSDHRMMPGGESVGASPTRSRRVGDDAQ